MMNVKEAIRNNLMVELDKCLSSLIRYDVDSLMPLFYVLCAHHEGHLVSIVGEGKSLFHGKMHIQPIEIVDGYESPLLKEIRNSVNPSFFEGQSAEAVFQFYSMCNEYINEFYQDIIEHIISVYTSNAGKYSGVSVTTQEIAQLMGYFISDCAPRRVYDPCAGLCSFAILPELSKIEFVCSELSNRTKVIADIRLNAAGKQLEINQEDCTFNWRGNSNCDCLASELPFGLRLNDRSLDERRPLLLEDFVIGKFIESESLSSAVLLVSASTCIRGNNKHIRKTLCEKNYVDAVIKLPRGVLSYTGVDSVILVLKKHRYTKDIKFVYADDCIISDGRNKKLNYQAVIERLEKTEGNQIGVVRVEETYSHDFSLDPVYYLHNMIEVQSGQTLVKFRDMTTQIRGERRFDDVTGRVLLSEHLCASITEFHTRSIDINSIELVNPDRYVKVSNKCVILNMTADKFYYKNDNDPLFVSPNFSCFEVNENICLPEYLIHVLLDNKRIRETYSQGIISRVNYNELYLPIYTNLRSQRLIVERIYRQEQNELKKKLEKLQVLSGKSSDLIHNLGITFTKMSAAIAVLRKENATSTQIDSPVNVLNDNIQFALRQINCTGTDFSHVKPELEKVNLYKTVSNYIMAWKNFGYKSFDVAPIKLNVSEDTMVEIDKDLFFTMLDCIFINAHQHGFNKRYNSHNKVIIDLQGVYADNNKYVMIGISNNGNPLTDGYSIKDFVERGNVGLNSSQDGLGGNHVMEIAHHFGGKISIVSESEWLSFNVLLPIYLTSDDTKFIEYGGEYTRCMQHQAGLPDSRDTGIPQLPIFQIHLDEVLFPRLPFRWCVHRSPFPYSVYGNEKGRLRHPSLVL